MYRYIDIYVCVSPTFDAAVAALLAARGEAPTQRHTRHASHLKLLWPDGKGTCIGYQGFKGRVPVLPRA